MLEEEDMFSSDGAISHLVIGATFTLPILWPQLLPPDAWEPYVFTLHPGERLTNANELTDLKLITSYTSMS